MARIRSRQPIHEATSSASVSGNTVKGVVILGPNSKNVGESGKPRVYTQAAMESAVERQVYEGCHAYVDHVEEAAVRPTRELLGVFENVRYEEGKVRGDLVVSARESWFLEDVKNPALAKAIGFSHDAMIDVTETESSEEVTSIAEAMSVDLVTRPATTRGVFESMSKKKPTRVLASLKIQEAEVGDKVTCNEYGYDVIGEVMKKAPALLIKVGDRLMTKFDDEVMTVTMSAPNTEAPQEAAPTDEQPKPEVGEEMPPETPSEDTMETKQMQERLAKLEVENSRLRLTEALAKFPAKAREASLKRLAGKTLTDTDIEGEVKALEEFQSAFATAPGVDPDLAGAPRGDAASGGVEDAARIFEAFGAFGGKSSGRERAVALAKEV